MSAVEVAVVFTRDELLLVRRSIVSRADHHPCDWPANRDAARSIEAKLDAAREAIEAVPS